MMIIEIRKLLPNAGKVLSIVCLLYGGWLFKEVDTQWIAFGLLALLLWGISELYLGLRINTTHKSLEKDIGLVSIFRVIDEIKLSQLESIIIKQGADKYYRVGLALHSGEFIELDKKPTLDKAAERQVQIENQLKEVLQLTSR